MVAAVAAGDLTHVLLVTFSGQGHVNPFLRLAKRIAAKGALVTFSSTENVGYRIHKAGGGAAESTPVGAGRLRFEFFSDGWDVGDSRRFDLEAYMPQLRSAGSRELSALILRHAAAGIPVTAVVTNPFVPWALDVAADMGIPTAVLWVQSCAVFSTYYHYHHSLADFPNADHPNLTVELPGVTPLAASDIPTFLLPTNPYPSLTTAILAQFSNLSRANWVFVNTFDELEREAISGISELSPVIPVGPLIELPTDESAEAVKADLWKAAECVEWLDGKPTGSVVYASVGSIVVLSKEEMVEMAMGMKGSGKAFVWVVREGEREKLPEGFEEEVRETGLVVEWAPQERVLAHPAVACFLTHCGWNSTLECLTSGVPVVAFPQFGDQVTDAKFLADVWGVGVHLRLTAAVEVEEEKKKVTFTRNDVERCIAAVTEGERAEEMRRNAARWKEAARKAVAEGGSSDRNILEFLEKIRNGSPPFVGGGVLEYGIKDA